jgi:3,4-dihydroxy 2-butanone 4-phosphate synthase/GTP cyclohydrolase II
MRTERLIHREYSTELNTRFGIFQVIAYRQITTDDLHLAFVKGGDWTTEDEVLVRVHSGMESNGLLNLLVKDGEIGLENALQKIAAEGAGVLLYMRHSEKHDDILGHLEALTKKQQNGSHDKHEDPIQEQRDFGVGAQILRDLGLGKIKLLTNKPRRRVALDGYGLEIVGHVEL